MAKKEVVRVPKAKQRGINEQALARLIQKRINQAETEGRVVDGDTARRIAAAVHRGLGGELERFAATGRLTHYHAARLELFYTLKDEPEFKVWGLALREFVNQQARAARGSKTKPHARHEVAKSLPRSAEERSGLAVRPKSGLPPPNPKPNDCERCDPEGVLVYVCNQPGDGVERGGLALQMQHQACRRYTHRRLRKRLEATFMDNAHSRHSGLRKLLGHVAICHNQRVVVKRLDRLPPGSTEADEVTASGARVLSANEQTARSNRRQAAFNRDIAALSSQRCGQSRKQTKSHDRSRL